MECACTVGIDVDERCTLLKNGWVKARIEHKCTECARIIPKGEEYFKEVSIFDTELDTYKTCEDCYSLRQVFFSNGWYYEQILEDLEEMIWECDGDVSVSCINMLTKPAKDWVLDIIDEVHTKINEDDDAS